MDVFSLEEESGCLMKSCREKYMTGLMIICLFLILSISGCWGKREVEDLAPLMGIGFDLGEKPGTYLITQQYAKTKKGGNSGAETEERTLGAEASSVREAFDIVSKAAYRTPFMGSLKVIVIGEDVAKAGGFNNMLDFAQRFAEFRRSMYLVIARGKAEDVLNLKLRSEQLPALYIRSIIEGGNELSAFPMVRLGHYLTVLGTESTAPILPVVEAVKDGEGIHYKAEKSDEAGEIRIEGAGVLNGDQLVDFLNDEETKGYMWLEDDVSNRLINTVDLKESNVKFSGQVLKSSTRYKVKTDGENFGLNYQVRTSIAIDEVLGLDRQLSGTDWIELVKEAEGSFAKVIQQECESAIKKQRELGFDFLGVGRHIEQRNPRYWKNLKERWKQEVSDFPVSFDIKVTVHNTGMSSSSATNSGGEGQD
ncbi:spore germination protein KC [Desulfosporosinus hippei DSM 8344]|uniref:Spore germination protein KC n=2 Tax=Desulfosporosinus TaxID=79206 RepID=A0A1G7WZD0_9FIRM|nr:spore germination protein KC [Desulfosporosinus hippei DSM 8344]